MEGVDGPDGMDGDGACGGRETGVLPLVDISDVGRFSGAAFQVFASGLMTRSLLNEPLPPLIQNGPPRGI
jgi:hypothetical protein